MAGAATDQPDPPADPRPAPAHRRRTAVVVAVAVALAVGLGAGWLLGHAARSPAARTGATSTTATPADATEVRALLPLTVCPTTFAVAGMPGRAPSAPSVPVRVPADLAHRLAVYTDSHGSMQVVAPVGWQCSAQYGADGSGGVTVYPAGEQPAPSGAGPATSGLTEAVSGSETSACVGCTDGQACPYFSAAARTWHQDFPTMGCTSAPAGERVRTVSRTEVSIVDPPGVKGGGTPSGGPDPADALMTYVPGSDDGSWLITCTLPPTDHAMCAASLEAFGGDYANR